MMDFGEKLLRDTLKKPASVQLDIKGAHHVLAPRPAGVRDEKLLSIIVKFLHYKTTILKWP